DVARISLLPINYFELGHYQFLNTICSERIRKGYSTAKDARLLRRSWGGQMKQMPKLNANLKAELLATGSVDVDASLLTGTSTSAAGPGTGQKSLFFTSGGHRIRLGINKNSQLAMIKENNDFINRKDNK
ncbi:hypothetical protein C5S29_00710, partial [ANME-1 cluster archaeon GoMg3.2]|nr:hypothetical protein [ANME-1 cluster archaeon GoMg3.2]